MILGLETSCDETSVALVQEHCDPAQRILFHRILSQDHHLYGGVIPELASRQHLDYLQALVQEGLSFAAGSQNIQGIAATSGPGLMGGLLVGVMLAKTLSMAFKKPFIAVNHLEGHALTVRLTHDVTFPYLLLLVSGGHCQVVEVFDVGSYRLVGETIDDAAGEAFDKVAQLLGLPYPGGPEIEKLALGGDPSFFDLPRPLKKEKNCAFSFSGLKTAVRFLLEQKGLLTEEERAHLAASFQEAVAIALVDGVQKGLKATSFPHTQLVVAGGVAANKAIGKRLLELCEKEGLKMIVPPVKLCTDNAAMIAWAGLERFRKGSFSPLDLVPRPRWPLGDVK